MCGITGVAWNTGATPVAMETLVRMTTAIAHRGPDDAGYYHSRHAPQGVDRDLAPLAAPLSRNRSSVFSSMTSASAVTAGSGAALGHRRLSIIDLAGGHQPLSNEDGTVWIAFNGEIYNYQELQPRLEQRGHRFHTASDTETIVHLYEEYGPDCLHQLRGMFAFAIWDARLQRLFLARDRIGKKPLLYRHDSQSLAFASELKSLLEIPGTPRTMDPAAVDAFLTYQYVPHPHCILAGYHKLPPAHFALYQEGQLDIHRYWRPYPSDAGDAVQDASPHPSDSAVPRRRASATIESARQELRDLLTEAVRLRMRSDVPLGAFLSGGVDSTIIAGLMQSLSNRPVQTFSIGFPVPKFDERRFAREAAEHLHTEHHEYVVEPAALQILPKLIWHYDEPFADSSAIPTMYLSEMTRQRVTVALSGDGGDELFAGYERYRAVQLAEAFDRLPRFLKRILTSPWWQKLPASVEQNSRRRRLKRLLSALGEPPETRYLKWMSIFDDSRRLPMYTAAFREELGSQDGGDFLFETYDDVPRQFDFTTRTTIVDILSYLPCDILTKVDIASMAYALEVRCPFLDQQVTEFATSLPMAWKRRGGKGKRILLETFGDLVPESIQHRAKMGFGVPLDHWFRGELQPLLKEVLLDPRSLSRGYFRPAAIEQLIDDHVAARFDHSYRLWSLLVLELWQQRFIDGE